MNRNHQMIPDDTGPDTMAEDDALTLGNNERCKALSKINKLALVDIEVRREPDLNTCMRNGLCRERDADHGFGTKIA